MNFKRNFRSGFTLIELLIVIGIISALSAALLVAFDPSEQIKKSHDAVAKNAVVEIDKATIHYSIDSSSLPWDTDPNCLSEIGANGNTLDNTPSCLTALINNGELKGVSNNDKHILSKIHMSICQDKAIMCFHPESKSDNKDPQTSYDESGNLKSGCPQSNGNSLGCYWCTDESSCSVTAGGGDGNGGGTGGGINSPTPTPANIWGKAISLEGQVPAYSPTGKAILQFAKTNYASSAAMDINNNTVTVEAWIKPKMQNTGIMQGYQIVNNTYSLTMFVKNIGNDIGYMYNFHIQSSTDSCFQTVVYSGTYSKSNVWDDGNFKRVSKAQFETWKHVVGILKNSVLYIYEDGVLLNTYNPPSEGHPPIIVCNDKRDMYIGAYGANPNLIYNYFQGLIDEVRISSIARYGNSYTVPTQPFTPDANTTMLYHFDNNTNDSSSNHLNGYLVGNVTYVDSDK